MSQPTDMQSYLEQLSESEAGIARKAFRMGIDEGYEEGKSITLANCFHPPEIKDADYYENISVPDLAAILKELKSKLDEVGAIKTEIQKAYDFLSIEILPDRMDEEGIETLKIKNVGRLQSSADIRCNVPAKNKDALKAWLVEHGHGSMVSETINSSTLKAFVREMMKEDKDWPKDLLVVHPYSRATVVKA